jgi:putative aminopeptidase FrvX
MNFELLKALSEVSGVSSREERVRELVKLELAGLVDEVQEDAMGNLIALKRAKKSNSKSNSKPNVKPNSKFTAKSKTPVKRVMLAAHMDEIGFLVKFIDDNGFLRIHNLGGFDRRNLFARDVIVCAKDGDLPGILNPAGKPIHIAEKSDLEKIPMMREFAVDLGLPVEEVKKLVRVGDPVSLVQALRTVGNYVVGKALDDRSGVYILIEVLRALKSKSLEVDLFAVFTTQEEVGLRGATTSAFGVEPDIGLSLDTTLAVDTPGVARDEAVTVSGQGVALTVMDSASIATRWLLDEFVDCAARNQIQYQLNILPLGGTDGAAMQLSRSGAATLSISLPSRYVHTIQEAVHKNDLAAEIQLLTAWLLGK